MDYNINKIKELRKEKKLTHSQISKELGIAQSTYGNFEAGRYPLSLNHIKKIAEIFAINVNDLLKNDDEEESKFVNYYNKITNNTDVVLELKKQLEFLQRQFEKVLDENGRLSRTLENLTASGGGRSVKLKATEQERIMLYNVA